VNRIEVFEDEYFSWWWVLYADDIERTRSGPFETEHAATQHAHAMHPDVHVEIVPCHLP